MSVEAKRQPRESEWMRKRRRQDGLPGVAELRVVNVQGGDWGIRSCSLDLRDDRQPGLQISFLHRRLRSCSSHSKTVMRAQQLQEREAGPA